MGRPNRSSPGLLSIMWLILTQILDVSHSDMASPVRLVDGRDSCSGRVQVLYLRVWGTACYEGWDLFDANVVCRELGCGEAKEVKVASYFGQSTEKIWMNKVNCIGDESLLAECAMDSWGHIGCKHDLYAGVVCQPRTRLVSGINSCSGRVEVLYNGTWGTVCDDDWGLPDAAVVCREVGCGNVIEAKSEAYFGKGSGQIWIDDINCSVSQHALSKCNFRPWGVHDCYHSEDAGVICQTHIRLVNSMDTCTGTVEVLHNGQWGAVCGDDWDLSDAAVVCREMGCGSIQAIYFEYIWQGNYRQTWMSNVSCSGEEAALSTCAFPGWGAHDCLSKYAGVFCSFPVRLLDGNSICSGRVEVFHDGQWGSVCDDGWDLLDAAVVCREIGCGDAVEAKEGSYFGRGTGPVLMNFVDCVGNESSLVQCNLDGWLPNGVECLNDAGVICTEFSSSYSNPIKSSDSSLKVLLRIEVETDPRFNPNDPRTLSKITEEMGKKLQISGPFSLTWRTQQGGKVFQEVTQKKNNAQKCD